MQPTVSSRLGHYSFIRGLGALILAMSLCLTPRRRRPFRSPAYNHSVSPPWFCISAASIGARFLSKCSIDFSAL